MLFKCEFFLASLINALQENDEYDMNTPQQNNNHNNNDSYNNNDNRFQNEGRNSRRNRKKFEIITFFLLKSNIPI